MELEAIIIPGLPNDIALQCLFRLPFSQIHCLRYVCKAWNSEIKPSELFRLRRFAAYKTQPLIILHPIYYRSSDDNDDDDDEEEEEEMEEEEDRRLLVFDPETGLSSDMPPLPASYKLPIDCRIAVVGSKLVVMGGYDEETERCLDLVFVFDFYSSTWGLGANMPDGPRMEFACDTYDNTTVFVAGGQDNREITFTSAWTYDVVSNIWNKLPDMIKDDDMEHKTYYCTGLFYHDKFEVYIIKPGHANIKIEIFEISTRQWSEAKNRLDIFWRHMYVEGSDQNLYAMSGDDLNVLKDNKQRYAATLPIEPSDPKIYDVSLRLIASPGHLWLRHSSRNYKGPYDVFKMDLKDHKWIKGKVPIKLFNKIDRGYNLII